MNLRSRRRTAVSGSSGGLDIVTIQRYQSPRYSTTSATLTAIDDTNLPITVTLAAGDEVHLAFSAPFGISSAGNVIGFDWLVDAPNADTVIGQSLGAWALANFEFGTNGTDSQQNNAMGLWTAAEPGVHIFKPRWRVAGGTTGYISKDGGTYTGIINHRAIIKSAA